MSESNKTLITEFLRRFSTGDVANTMALMSNDATWWVAGTMPISGTYDKAAFSKLLAGVLDTCKGPLVITPKLLTAEGDHVAVEAESRAELLNGRTYSNLYHFLFCVRDGRIVSVREYMDTMHANTVLCTP